MIACSPGEVIQIDVNPQHSLDLPIVLGDTWTHALWAQIIFVHSERWTKLAEVPAAPIAAPPFQSTAMDDDFPWMQIV